MRGRAHRRCIRAIDKPVLVLSRVFSPTKTDNYTFDEDSTDNNSKGDNSFVRDEQLRERTAKEQRRHMFMRDPVNKARYPVRAVRAKVFHTTRAAREASEERLSSVKRIVDNPLDEVAKERKCLAIDACDQCSEKDGSCINVVAGSVLSSDH